MAENFVEWFADWLCQIEENLINVIIIVLVFAFCIVTLPVRVIPFVYQYLFKYKKNATNKNTITNADLIRSMSDEELAVTIPCPNETGMTNIECDHSDQCNCRECCLKWLQSEAEE